MKSRWWLAVIAVLVVVFAFYGFWRYKYVPDDRIYRIGYENDPPLHYPDKNGHPTGLAVEVVREAAQRAGVRLQWIFQRQSSEAALRSGQIDLWPLMTIRPERKGVVYITEPYRENESCILVPAESPFQRLAELDGHAICLDGGPLAQRLLNNQLPHIRLQLVDTPADAIASLCRGKVEAAYLDGFSAISTLLDGTACSGRKLRLIRVPETRGLLGIGATFQAAKAADAIRKEIGRMAEEGHLAALVSRWSDTSGRTMELNAALAQSQRRVDYLSGAIAGILVLMCFIVWMALRLRHQRNRMIQAEEARQKSEKRYVGLFGNMTEGVALSRIIRDQDGQVINYQVVDVNPCFEKIIAMHSQDVVNHMATEIFRVGEPPYLQECLGCTASGEPFHLEAYFSSLEKYFNLSIVPIEQDLFAMIFSDITSRKQAEAEKSKLEGQLQQVQRMESVGRLVGGVAHDFNNLLTVINGYSDLLLNGKDCTETQQKQLQQIQGAGQQAASLTQQLLAFSRRQVIQPKLVDLNRVIRETREMLSRLIGEDIELITKLHPDLGLTMADQGQLHQVLMNLVVNARDAMPKGGRILIETSNVFLDSEYAAIHPEVNPGPCILLSVSDTGVGIEEEHLRHIFEPFFTTKAQGEGTGLGLSMVYGIIRQNQGWIWPYSEPGKGTTFKIYLPQVRTGVEEVVRVAADNALAEGSETILLVEDQENVRFLANTVLQKCGYRVIEAAHGAGALESARVYEQKIHLLLTDVVLPGMTGKDLADNLKESRPDIKVLYSSGYTENVIAHHGVLEPGIHYLAKPYTPGILAAKVRQVLDASE